MPKTDGTTRQGQRTDVSSQAWLKTGINRQLVLTFSLFPVLYRPLFLETPVLSWCCISDDLLLRVVFVYCVQASVWFPLQICLPFSFFMCGLFESRLRLIFSALYAVPVMSEKSTKISRNFFGDADKTRLFLLFRHQDVYSYFFVNMLFTSKGTSLAQIRMGENWAVVSRYHKG